MPLLGPNGEPARANPQQEAPGPDSGPPEPIVVDTAFLVFRLPDGTTVMHHDTDLPLKVVRPPTRDEVKGMCANVISDTNNVEVVTMTTQNVVGNLMRVGQQAANGQLTDEEKQALVRSQGNGFPR